MAKGQHLTALTEAEVVVHILQSIGPVGTRGDTLHHKVASTIGTGDTQHRLGLESRIRQVVVESYHDALHRLQVRGIKHIACHLEGVDALTCGEGEGVRPHRIALVIVADGIAEVYGVGGVLLQRVLQLYHHLLS